MDICFIEKCIPLCFSVSFGFPSLFQAGRIFFNAIIVNRPAKTKVKETSTMKNGTINRKIKYLTSMYNQERFWNFKNSTSLKSRIKYPRDYQQIE